MVRVEDHGVGIPASERERVFERFHRVDRPDFAYPAGTGLGLSIARRMAEANGAVLELEWSEFDVGSSFVLKLPTARDGAMAGGGLKAGSSTSGEGSYR